MHHDAGETKKVALAFLLGGLIGAGIALLYAPQSGSETRKDIAKTARKLKRKTVELVDDTIDSMSDLVENVKDVTSDIVERSVDLSESAKKEILRAYDQGQKVIAKQKDRLMEALKI